MKLRLYQKQAIEYGLKQPYSILALDPGLGKTRCAVDIHERMGGNCLVIAPSYLIGNWQAEIKKWGRPNLIVTAIKKGADIYDVFDSDFVLVSYDLAQKAEYFFDWADMVVLDEAHLIKSQKAKRTQFIHKAIYENSIKRCLLLTGTPIKNRVEEFYSLLALCNYQPGKESGFLDEFPDSIGFADHFSYRQEYTIEVGHRLVRIIKWSGIRNEHELKQHLNGHYLRIKSEDVLDLPPVIFKDIRISDSEDEELKHAFDAYFKSDESHRKTNPTAKSQAALRKASITTRYVESLVDEAGAVVVYSDHVDASELIANHFKVTALNGTVPAQRRMQLVKEFQAGHKNVLVCTIGAMSTGINLTRSNHLVLNDYPWVPGDLKQTIYRIQRLGQKQRCVVHRMIGSPQDEYIMDTIQSKIETIEEAT